MSAPYNKTDLNRAKKSVRRQLRRISAAMKEGNTSEAELLIARFLNLPAAKFVAATNAYREMPKHHKKAGMDLSAIAKKVDPFVGTAETAIFNLKLKDNGEFRPYWNFGIENRTLQHLVKLVLEATADLHPNQYGLRGARPAMQTVLTRLNAGYHRVTEVDIEKCFTNVGAKALPGYLHIPDEVVHRVISAEHLTPTDGDFVHSLSPEDMAEVYEDVPGPLNDLLQEGQQGIPQGAACSTLVAEMLFTGVFSALPAPGIVVNYVDNFLVMAKTQEEFKALLECLWGFLEKHPAGPFALKVKSSSAHGEPFEFLGYSITCTNGVYKAAPSPKNMKKFCRVFDRGLHQIKSKKHSYRWRRRKSKDLKHYVRSWTSSFAAWGKCGTFRAQRLHKIQQTSKYLFNSK